MPEKKPREGKARRLLKDIQTDKTEAKERETIEKTEQVFKNMAFIEHFTERVDVERRIAK